MKLYYTDELTTGLYACAYMAEEFDVEFEYVNSDGDKKNHYRAYIHPDSYHIFKPQVGDLLESYYEPSCIEYNIYDGDEAWLNVRSYWKVILRDGKQFFTPEREESTTINRKED